MQVRGLCMSTPRIPPVPPNKGGELDKTAPSEHRKVEKVEKISKVSEVDDESSWRRFRQFVEGPHEEEEGSLPTPFALPSLSGGAPLARSLASEIPPLKDSTFSKAAENAIPSPNYSPTPSMN